MSILELVIMLVRLFRVHGLCEGSVDNLTILGFYLGRGNGFWVNHKQSLLHLALWFYNLFIAFSLGIISATVKFYGVLYLFPDHL